MPIKLIRIINNRLFTIEFFHHFNRQIINRVLHPGFFRINKYGLFERMSVFAQFQNAPFYGFPLGRFIFQQLLSLTHLFQNFV